MSRKEGLEGFERMIKNHEENLALFIECEALNLAQQERTIIKLLHRLKADYVLERKNIVGEEEGLEGEELLHKRIKSLL